MEVWKDIKGYESRYKVSCKGRVISKEREIWNGKGYYMKREQEIKGGEDTQGYINIGLSKDNKLRSFALHRLVATAFIPNPEGKKQVNHKDGDKKNNIVSNLEWVTNRENYDHAIKNGLKCMKKATAASVKQSSKPVYQIDPSTDKVINKYPSIMEAERQTGIWNSHIVGVCKGQLITTGGYKWEYVKE